MAVWSVAPLGAFGARFPRWPPVQIAAHSGWSRRLKRWIGAATQKYSVLTLWRARLSGAGWPDKACTSSVASGLTLDSPGVGTDGSKDQQMRHCTPATVQSVGCTKKCRKSGSVGVADRKISEKFQKAAAPYQDACVRIVGDSTADSVPGKGLASANPDRITLDQQATGSGDAGVY